MKTFTQKALFVVLTVFVLVGIFYGLATPVTGSSSALVKPTPSVGAPVPPFCPPACSSNVRELPGNQ
jgi:hypothetical protein